MARNRDALLRVVNRIGPGGARGPGGAWLQASTRMFGERARHLTAAGLTPQDVEFVSALRQALAELAARVGVESLDDERQRSVLTALDGAELVTRGQLAIGSPEQLPILLPSFVFLVALPIVEQDEALSLSRRAEDLIRAPGR